MAPPILLVDDDIALAQTMAQAIENVGIPVERCNSGVMAIELIHQNLYAVVFLDLILETLRGVDRTLVAAVMLKPVDFGLFTD